MRRRRMVRMARKERRTCRSDGKCGVTALVEDARLRAEEVILEERGTMTGYAMMKKLFR